MNEIVALFESVDDSTVIKIVLAIAVVTLWQYILRRDRNFLDALSKMEEERAKDREKANKDRAKILEVISKVGETMNAIKETLDEIQKKITNLYYRPIK